VLKKAPKSKAFVWCLVAQTATMWTCRMGAGSFTLKSIYLKKA
jgi:hypothetical protein